MPIPASGGLTVALVNNDKDRDAEMVFHTFCPSTSIITAANFALNYFVCQSIYRLKIFKFFFCEQAHTQRWCPIESFQYENNGQVCECIWDNIVVTLDGEQGDACLPIDGVEVTAIASRSKATEEHFD